MAGTEDRDLDVLAMLLELDPGQRAGVLERECAGDAAMRDRVEALLAEYENIPSMFLGGDDAPSDGEQSLQMPERIGAYRITGVLGCGAMGVVYEAVQTRPMRRVALKIIRPGYASASQTRRFGREADLLGQLQHPGIAQVYEASVAETPQGSRPFFVMELIEGLPLDQHAGVHGLDVSQRLELLARVCDAVEYAHQRGIVHRDLKPSNVLVVGPREDDTGMSTSRDAIGRPKVVDFGISRVVDAERHMTTSRTEAGQLVGTLAYMSPEQVAGDPRRVGVRSDVYALGVIGYELVSGRSPRAIRGLTVAEAARVIRDDDPTPLRTHSRTLAGDIDTVIAKAMDRDPARRYAHAGELAADLRRVIANVPIEARPASAAYRLRKFASRNAGLVVGIAVAFFVLIAGVIGTSLGWAEAVRTNARLDATLTELTAANNELERVSEFQESQLSGVSPEVMGMRMREAVLAQAPEAERGEIDRELRGVNFTDVARGALEHDVFEPAIGAIDSQFAEVPLVRARLLQAVASTLAKLGMLEQADGPQRVACEIRDQVLGEDHPDSVDSRAQRARLLSMRREHDEAIALMSSVLEWRRAHLGEHAEPTIGAMIEKAEFLRLARDFEASQDLGRQALAIAEEHFGADDPITVSAARGVGATLMAARRETEAEPFLRCTYEQRLRLYGEDDPRTVDAMMDLATLDSRLGKAQEAEKLVREVLRWRSQHLGANHPSTINASVSLGVCLDSQSRFEEAAQVYRAALELQRRAKGAEHPDTLLIANNLATTLDTLGQYDEAEALLREAVRIRRRLLGDRHLDTLTAIGNLGLVLKNKGEDEEAEPYYREMLEGMRATLGNDSPFTLQAMQNYGVVLLSLGRADEAIPLYEESLAGRRRVLGEDHPATLNAIYNMGNMLVSLGRLDEAEPYCVRALEKYSELGDKNIGTLYSLGNLASLRAKQGRLDEAEALYRAQYERMAEVFGPEHPSTTLAKASLDDVRTRRAQQAQQAQEAGGSGGR